MRIQHNIMAMNAYRNYTNNVSAMKGNLEKLSSGYKINRAGDDAAGLAISEKMRAQITGLQQAQNNAKSGINLVQTAEGALQEVQDMLNRMVKLAEQSANGTYDDDVDRNQLQKEFTRLTEEINRIDQAANFNGKALFGGPAATTSLNDGIQTYETNSTPSITGTAGTSIEVKAAAGGTAAKYTINVTGVTAAGVSGAKIDGVDVTWKTDLDTTMKAFVDSYNKADKAYTASYTGSTVTLTAKNVGAVSASNAPAATVSGVTVTSSVSGANPTTPAVTMNASGLDKTKILAAAPSAAAGDEVSVSVNSDKKLEVKVGSTVIGTAVTAFNGTAQEFEIKTSDGTSLGKIKFNSAPAAADTFTNVSTGLSISGGGSSQVETVGSGKLADGGIDFSNTAATVTAGDIAALKTEIGKLGGNTGKILINQEVDVDLSKALDGISAGASVKTVADALLTAAKKAATDWNNANSTKDYKYENVRISTTAAGAEGDIIAQSAGDGFYILMDKTPKTNPPANTTGQVFTFQVGDTNDSYNKITVTINAISSSAIKDISEGTDLYLKDLKVEDEENAGIALKALKGMVNYISDIRGDLGATQNRLNHTINNLSVMTENIQDAESTIRDTDVADEMMAYTKNNILIQSAQAMLAQANQVPQGVLQLLQ